MARYLTAIEQAFEQVIVKQVEKPKFTKSRHYASDQANFIKPMNLPGPIYRHPFPILGIGPDPRFLNLSEALGRVGGRGSERRANYRNRKLDPKYREKEGVGVVISTFTPTELRFDSFRAPVTGRYKIRLKAHSIWVRSKVRSGKSSRRIFPDYTNISKGRRSELVTLYGDRRPQNPRKLVSFDTYPEPGRHEFDLLLLEGETIRPDAARLFRPRGGSTINPLAEEEAQLTLFPILRYGTRK